MMFMARLKTALAGFGRKEDGTIALEAMIVIPVIFWSFLATFSVFHSFRTYSINQKAAFTIGDAISRETAPLDDEYLTGAYSLFNYLAGATGDPAIRVTSLRWDGNNERFYRDWSKTRGPRPELSNDDVREWATRLPVMPHNERVMLVETWADYEPPFKTGIEQREIRNFIFTRPRFAPRVCWNQCN